MEEKNTLWLAIISVVAITGIVVMGLAFSGGISGQVPRNTDTPPAAIKLVAPADGTLVSTTPTLDWSKTHMAEFIVLYVDDEPGFSTPIAQDIQLRKNQRAYTVPEGYLQSGNTYYWRVVAYNSAGAANSETFAFTVQ